MTWTCSYCGWPNFMEDYVCHHCGKGTRPNTRFWHVTRLIKLG